jgi:hypothetical protein
MKEREIDRCMIIVREDAGNCKMMEELHKEMNVYT